ncbi:permease [Ensifer sp. MPMI2T]|nr:permease [Ensifer sp. MPMI2T]
MDGRTGKRSALGRCSSGAVASLAICGDEAYMSLKFLIG